MTPNIPDHTPEVHINPEHCFADTEIVLSGHTDIDLEHASSTVDIKLLHPDGSTVIQYDKAQLNGVSSAGWKKNVPIPADGVGEWTVQVVIELSGRPSEVSAATFTASQLPLG
ncbi:MAG: hypothetical protein JSS66_14635 [Armatimonadetes bacterium]|nr:hypothetical protein [Armatimonadota bacterium]